MNLKEIETEELIQELQNRGYIRVLWNKEDIEMTAQTRFDITLTNEQLNEVVESIESSFDANVGVNWDVIADNIDYIIN
jgi:ferric iron reductase protein FhuF